MRPRGSGTITTRADGKKRAFFPFDSDGTREEIDGSPFATQREAEDALDGILETLHESGTRRGGVTVAKLGKDVFDVREKDGYRATANERNVWKVHVEATELGRMSARLVTRGDIRRWLSKLRTVAGKRPATQTKRNALNLVRAVFASAVDDELFEDNPADGMKVKDHGTSIETSTWLTLAECSRLLLHSTDPAVALALATGLRSGELRALRWEDVGDDAITVRFGKPNKPPKNGKIRQVPILPLARMALATLPRRGPLVLPSITGMHRTQGRIVPPEDWKAWLKAAELGRRVRWHDLRHSCATLLLTGATGKPWSLEAVKEFLGHSSIRVTERYAKATGSLAEKAAREIQKGSKPLTPEQAKALDILLRCGWDLNPRMSVLQTADVLNDRATLDRLWILAGSVARAVASDDPHRDDRALDLAELAFAIVDAATQREAARTA